MNELLRNRLDTSSSHNLINTATTTKDNSQNQRFCWNCLPMTLISSKLKNKIMADATHQTLPTKKPQVSYIFRSIEDVDDDNNKSSNNEDTKSNNLFNESCSHHSNHHHCYNNNRFDKNLQFFNNNQQQKIEQLEQQRRHNLPPLTRTNNFSNRSNDNHSHNNNNNNHIECCLMLSHLFILPLSSLLLLSTTKSSTIKTLKAVKLLNKNPILHHRPNKNFNLLFIIFFLIITALISQVSCLGIFELRLDKFVNELNRDASGRCCGHNNNNTDATIALLPSSVAFIDHHRNKPSPPSPPATTKTQCDVKCQTFYRICFKNYQANIDASSTCLYGEQMTPVVFSSTSSSDNIDNNYNNNVDNSTTYNYTIKFPFNFTWPGTFSLIIEVWNNASIHAPVNPHHLTTRSLIVRSFESRRDRLRVGHLWTHQKRIINQTQLAYSYRVLCNDNYYGESCTLKCTPRDDHFGHYKCGSNGEKICHNGWSSEYCDKPICRSCNETNGNCIGPELCSCRLGWSGEDCNQCVIYPNCKHGYCNAPMECICKEGWGGLLCDKDLNYCTNNQPCINGGLCTNTGKSEFTCQCPPGFAGKHCEKVVDSCDLSPCLNGGTCKSQTPLNYTCECPAGYHGRHCERVLNACSNSPCENGGECIDGPSGFLCICKLGFSGSKCETRQKDCMPNPCLNGGSCLQDKFNTNDSYTCQCRAGFTGDHCETNINDCESNPCLNGGTCFDEINSFRCRCASGFVGEMCQMSIDNCLMKPCVNFGTCINRINDYMCICPPGFTGKDCSINIDECFSNPCFNGGHCIDQINGYKCRCSSGYTGQHCEYSNRSLFPQNNSSLPPSSPRKGNEEPAFSSNQLSIIIIGSIVLPLIIILISICVIFCRHLKTQGVKIRAKREEAEARRQNEHNAIMNNKYLHQYVNRSAANVIVNTLNRPASLHQLNKCHKVTNEYVFGEHFNKCATLHKGFKSINLEKVNNESHYYHHPHHNHNHHQTINSTTDDPYSHQYERIMQKTCNLLSNNLTR